MQTRSSSRSLSSLLVVLFAISLAGCFSLLDDGVPAELSDEASNEARDDVPEESLATAQQASEISTSCGNYNQAPCGNSITGTYCHYNLYKFSAYPRTPVRCLCESDALSLSWAGPSVGCVVRGCENDKTVAEKVRNFQRRDDLGSITRDHVYDIARDINVGRFIDGTTYLYRATSYPKEIDHMVSNKKTLAKAYFRAPSWSKIGPQVTAANRDAVALPFQLLAISNSDEPKSQFSSAALTYDVAKTFAAKDAYVYAFKLNPKSNILGIDDCDAPVLTGELQVQVANGTSILSLRRKKATGGAWEYLNKNKQWVKSKCNRNNPLWECSRTDVKDEL